MARSVPEWIGKTDDTPIPDRVKIRLFETGRGHCAICSCRLYHGRWAADHKVAIINGGQNRENNLHAICGNCHTHKTREDVKIKAITYRKKKAHLGIRKKSKFPGSKNSPWKRKIDGTWVRR